MAIKNKLSVKFIWILLAGVVIVFGLLTFLIVRRESALIMSTYTSHAEESAGLVFDQMKHFMLENNQPEMSNLLAHLNNQTDNKIGVIGHDGKPAFGSTLTANEKIFTEQKTLTVIDGSEMTFYKPLPNETACHACHSPLDSTRGMMILKRSLLSVQGEVNKTARSIVYFALLLGLLSEIFLVYILRSMVLQPIEELIDGAEHLRAGDLSYRVLLKTDDEMGVLADCFNHMAENIESTQRGLERTVSDKTLELRTMAELSLEVFKGELTLDEIIDRFLDAIVQRMGYDYAVMCLLDTETGLLLQEHKRGIAPGFCVTDIPLVSDHPFAQVVREARPTIKSSDELKIAEILYGDMAIVPVLSHQRRRCRDITHCMSPTCPGFDSHEDRCWLLEGTHCKSPRAVIGKEKIYGCLFCQAFPVLGVLTAGKSGGVSSESLHSLEILGSEIASAIENQRFLVTKKNDIEQLIKLQDVSVAKLQNLDLNALSEDIATSAVSFARMDGAVLWLKSEQSGTLRFQTAFNVAEDAIPLSIELDGTYVGEIVKSGELRETIDVSELTCLKGIMASNDYHYAAVVPLGVKSEMLGCLTLFKKTDFRMTDSELALIKLYAGAAAASLNTAWIYGQLKVEKDFSDAIFNNMSCGLMVLDDAGKMLRMNRVGREILALDGKELEGVGFMDIMPPEFDLKIIDSPFGTEVEMYDGPRNITVSFNSSTLLDALGGESGNIVIFRDMTEIKRLQAEVRRKQHFEAMAAVISGVAHEIRNPLFGISSIVQILTMELKTPQHKTLLQAVYKEVQRMKRLVEEFLTYGKPLDLKKERMDIRVFLEKIKEYAEKRKPEIVFSIEIPEGSFINADPDRLYQVFSNLADNAINAGATRLEARLEKHLDRMTVKLTDNGAGVRKEIIKKIFNPFFTTRKEGTGLGLAICRRIIEEHDGTIDIESVEGQGSVVKVELPL